MSDRAQREIRQAANNTTSVFFLFFFYVKYERGKGENEKCHNALIPPCVRKLFVHSTLATLCLPHTLLASGSPESSAYLQVCFNLSVWSSRRSIFLLIDVSAPRSQLLIWCVQRCHDSMHFIWTYPSLRQPRAPKLSLVFLFFYILKKSVADSLVYESAVKLQKCFMDCKTILNFFHLVLFWLWDEWIMTEFSFLDNCSIFYDVLLRQNDCSSNTSTLQGLYGAKCSPNVCFAKFTSLFHTTAGTICLSAQDGLNAR